MGDQLVAARFQVERIWAEAADVCRSGAQPPSGHDLGENAIGAPRVDDLSSLAEDDVGVLTGRKAHTQRT
jgi:hypothetical protein